MTINTRLSGKWEGRVMGLSQHLVCSGSLKNQEPINVGLRRKRAGLVTII
jgi:hypothetical protein